MVKLKMFLICLSVLLFTFSSVACVEMYALERAVARGIYQDVMDDMQDIGYLDENTQKYYQDKMLQLGWNGDGDFFQGSWPQDISQRAQKERRENIVLVLRIRPSKISQWMNQLLIGEALFTFSGSRPSEYFDPGW